MHIIQSFYERTNSKFSVLFSPLVYDFIFAEKLLANAAALGDSLDRDLPELKEEEEEEEISAGLEMYAKEVKEFDFDGPFDDQETENFYLVLPELAAMFSDSAAARLGLKKADPVDRDLQAALDASVAGGEGGDY